jgi:tetratricopeptide (TPR) repeat protein
MERMEAGSGAGQDKDGGRIDFLVSYAQTDQSWAEWIAWCLEHAGYSVIIAAWDFRPGANFVYEMDQALKKARRMIAVLSPAYLRSEDAFAEWAEMFRRDPRGRGRLLVPVQIQPCNAVGLLGPLMHIDLVGISEQEARERLLAGVQQHSPHPMSVAYPGLPHLIPERPDFPGALPSLWTMPYRRNPLFTGREDLLEQLGCALHSGQVTALSQPQAISGLGGIGKTQVAVEYAYRHVQDYRAVLWTTADSREALIAGFVKLAELLGLPEREEQEQLKVVAAVRRWLEQHTDWLLVFDNADEVQLVEDFLPRGSSGHILLTTRSQIVGPAITALRVEVMGLLEGALLLLRRAKLIASDASLEDLTTEKQEELVNQAVTLVDLLDGLPLALNQAGAYIEKTGCRLQTYLDLYQAHHQKLLAERDPLTPYPASVATTWDLSFGKVKETNPAAVELLQLCAYLSPDGIPEELIVEGASYWPARLKKAAADRLALERAIEAARAYSLLERQAEQQTLSMHRLVQAVLKDRLMPRMQRRWAERVVKAVNCVYPSGLQVEQWPRCLRYLAQAQVCASLIEQYRMQLIEAGYLLGKTADYLSEHALYAEAEPLYRRTLDIREQQLGLEHPDTADILNNLAGLYYAQGRYTEAESLYQRALAIWEQQLGPQHPATAQSLNNLAALYRGQGRYTEAEPLYQRALAIWEQQLGPAHPNTATSLNNLALLYYVQGRYAEAEPLYQRALLICEQQLGPQHPDTATNLDNLAELYREQGRYTEAESLYQRALTIREHQLGTEHPTTAQSLNNLALLYHVQGRYTEAEPLYQQALLIREQKSGPAHPDTATSLSNLAELYREQGRYIEAEPLYRRALTIREQQLGPVHPDTATNLNNLAELYREQGRYIEAEPLYQRALLICEQQLGPAHPDTASSLNNLASLYYHQGRYAEAEPLYRRALAICEQQLGPAHPYTAGSLNNLASLYYHQGRYAEAESLVKRVLAVCERRLGEQHPHTITVRKNYVSLLRKMGHGDEAREMEARVQQVSEPPSDGKEEDG